MIAATYALIVLAGVAVLLVTVIRAFHEALTPKTRAGTTRAAPIPFTPARAAAGTVRRPVPSTPYARPNRPSAEPVNLLLLPDGMPNELPVRTRPFLLTHSEAAFLATLEAALPAGSRVLPNVRLNDLFYITTRHPSQQNGPDPRLRDTHVDFLVVSGTALHPVFAIELGRAGHDAQQQARDAVKDVAFRSAGLPLVRLRAERPLTVAALQAELGVYFQATALSRAPA
ncbi:DUF2726 domain-containing protein (plasmid) [Deinococcus taeanensis]|uniref:DUF2726 domain-containing protein n=1 Tax=Deinococcus taeanensis TaxID=2737050 RepID=UPI001CDBFFDD|nr:DUF2726 domain-containing protein [Deinococcus taeanensis]UBV44721.1 DUF2726 domain-containing protein [Deinococcus taeanensis]